jgi:hypothetical protein
VTSWRALIRPYRSELRVGLLLGVVLLIVVGGVVLRMVAFGIPATCFGSSPTIDCSPYRPGPIDEYGRTLGTLLGPATFFTVAVPLIVAVVLGVALVSREIEQQTTVFVWSMTPSRVRWLLRLAALIGAFVVGLGLLGGILGDLLAAVQQPYIEPYRNFQGFGLRGPILAAAAFFAFGLVIPVGSVLGRQLPTLLLGGLLLAPALFGVSLVNDAWLRSEAQTFVIEHPEEPYPLLEGARQLDSLVRTPNGDIVSWEEAYARYGEELNSAGSEGSPFLIAIRYIPGDVYPLAVARLAVILAVVGLGGIALTALVVTRRRPYQ